VPSNQTRKRISEAQKRMLEALVTGECPAFHFKEYYAAPDPVNWTTGKVTMTDGQASKVATASCKRALRALERWNLVELYMGDHPDAGSDLWEGARERLKKGGNRDPRPADIRDRVGDMRGNRSQKVMWARIKPEGLAMLPF